ncbi:sensor domain-containing diguanylate cyclase [Marinomonas profundimaris]|nr:sensor domain-containing diguanylate cyclase [Marinomonas profundimaris]
MLKTIKTKIITTYSLVMIAFTSTLLLTTFLTERNRVLDLELEKSIEISRMHAEILGHEFSRYITMLQMVSYNPEIQLRNKDSIDFQLKKLLTLGKGDFINAIYIDQDLMLTDANGNTNKVTHPAFLKAEQWAGKEYNISTPVFSRFEKKPVIIVAVPILNNLEQWTGTIGVALPLSAITKKLSFIKLTKGSYAWLADSNGMIVSHPDERFIMKVQLSTTNSDTFPGFGDIVKRTQVESHGYGHYLDTRINESKVVTFAKISNLPGWNLFVTTKKSEVFHEVYEILSNVIVTSVVLMLIFLLLINRLSRNLVRPLLRLSKHVKASVNDKHHQFDVIESNDEIGQLSKAFDDAFKKIHSHTAYLEEVVSRRTQEIHSKNVILKSQNKALEDIASLDPLTHLYNRRAFNVLIEKEVLHNTKHSLPPTLVVLDIDHFKKINDQFGHDVGDDILCLLAHELSETNQSGNDHITCRWGGEEFVILIPNASKDTVSSYMTALQEKIANANFSPIEKLTFSAGVATMWPDETFKEWFQRADRAMYDAKAAGRDNFIWG